MSENTYAGEHASKKTRRDGDVYTGMQAKYASDRHIYMLAIISRKTGKLVYTI